MSSGAPTAARSASPTIPAATGTARSARAWPAPQWLADRQAELLPVPYFHVVFTVPAPIAAIALQNKAVVYDILFRAAAETLRTIAADPKHLGAEIGMIAVLHTWGQNLHPPSSCPLHRAGRRPVADGSRWVACRPGFFLPVRVLSRLYRRLFLERLQAAFDAGQLSFFGDLADLAGRSVFAACLRPLRAIQWVVYAKRPFGGPSRCSTISAATPIASPSPTAASLALADGQVRFRWKDYRHHDKPKVMTLDADEFIRRFLLHVLPDGFHRIRHYGFLANGRTASPSSPIAVGCWRPPSRRRLPLPPTIASAISNSPAVRSTFVHAAAAAWSRSVSSPARPFAPLLHPGTPHDLATRHHHSPVSRSGTRYRCRFRAVAPYHRRQVASAQSALRAATTSGAIHRPPRRNRHQNPARHSLAPRRKRPPSRRLDHRQRSIPIGRNPRSAASFNQASVQSRTPAVLNRWCL